MADTPATSLGYMLTVRRLDPALVRRLKIRAATNGRSMEAEARVILAEAMKETDHG